jgi:hypothetical protein
MLRVSEPTLVALAVLREVLPDVPMSTNEQVFAKSVEVEIGKLLKTAETGRRKLGELFQATWQVHSFLLSCPEVGPPWPWPPTLPERQYFDWLAKGMRIH